MLIVPSILNANNINLEKNIYDAKNAGVMKFHIDIMDGHFVPNLSFGPELICDFKKTFQTTFAEIHLMSNKPQIFVPAFVKAGADLIELHYEAMSERELDNCINYLHNNGVKVGIAVKPDTPISVLYKYLNRIDQILIMSVYPGFGGQRFINNSIERIEKVHKLLCEIDRNINLEVDGGINDQTIVIAKSAGADLFVVGSYIFNSKSIFNTIKELNNIISK